jgi:hypothetical protein
VPRVWSGGASGYLHQMPRAERLKGCSLMPAPLHRSPCVMGRWRGRSGVGLGDHLAAAPARLVRPDHDRQARGSYALAVNEMSSRMAEPARLPTTDPEELPQPRRQIESGHVAALDPDRYSVQMVKRALT